MNYTNSFFTENTKMAELVISNPTLMLTLSRFGIELGFGDQNVKEVCEKAKVSPSFFLLICKRQKLRSDLSSFALDDFAVFV